MRSRDTAAGGSHIARECLDASGEFRRTAATAGGQIGADRLPAGLNALERLRVQRRAPARACGDDGDGEPKSGQADALLKHGILDTIPAHQLRSCADVEPALTADLESVVEPALFLDYP